MHHPLQPFYPGLVITPAETALDLKLVTETDLLRLKTIARLHARGLPPDVGWEDLLQEAFSRVLAGSRQRPDGVAMVVFLAGVMRSLRAAHWRRVHGASGGPQSLPWERESGDAADIEPKDPTEDPERALIAWQELAAIERLFAEDAVAGQIIDGLADGKSAEEIRQAHGIGRTDYDSARRRIRRTFLREGLTCEQK